MGRNLFLRFQVLAVGVVLPDLLLGLRHGDLRLFLRTMPHNPFQMVALFGRGEPGILNIICVPGNLICIPVAGHLSVYLAGGAGDVRKTFFKIKDIAMTDRAGYRRFFA
jgi:hypothetical protein